ncbi:hypothetical protein GCM10027405_06260 [Arthrobacter alkaliphilus]
MDHPVAAHHHQGFRAGAERFVYGFPQVVHAAAPEYDDVEARRAEAAGGLVPRRGMPSKSCGWIDGQHDPSAGRHVQPIKAATCSGMGSGPAGGFTA